ncbi:NADH:flavin oxidoreductase/NADH oxidase-like protein [Daldinia caldariorum]|uniref:NADH:flavin oxidoreductase/NADH oxidase-like protein n=1 Tax=Daldinia caldariorum TaxID=326644 RepID=UPI002007B7E3|nr:NADH:flavin oxidoreductase/NADH oxidase-like protein [Daldinia caldariorum]KAI1468022.1 NADH:flavin oxidoreductase/NADH oxidase-like protein [Daldinia caldariorum]
MPVKRYDSSIVDVAPLGQPLKFEFSGKVAKNRFYKASMAEDLASWNVEDLEERGIPTKELIELYRVWGENEWGVIATGNIDIEFDMLDAIGDSIITPECPFSGPRFEAFQELAKAATAHGSLVVGQVTHPGRQLAARIRKDTISASATQHPPKNGIEYAKPRAATKEDIARVVDGFAHAAEYLDKAGFDGIQLHGAHGYLIAQFLSETTNQRTDEYGGSITNRLRLVSEIAREIKRRVSPDFIVGIKVNSVEFQEKGIKPADTRILCETFQELGFDYVELSGGNHEDIGWGTKKDSTAKREAYFLEFVRDVVPHLSKTKKILTGGFRTTAAMVDALDILDGIGLGRPAAQEPRLAADILAGKVASAVQPVDGVVDDVWLSLSSAGSQMVQIVRGQEPFDLSNPKLAESFKKDLAAQIGKIIAANGSLEIRGFPELSDPDATSHPYGVPY